MKEVEANSNQTPLSVMSCSTVRLNNFSFTWKFCNIVYTIYKLIATSLVLHARNNGYIIIEGYLLLKKKTRENRLKITNTLKKDS